jgi:hypothetical protein
MLVGRPIAHLVLSDKEIKRLQGSTKPKLLYHSLMQREQIDLTCGALATE